MVKQDNAVVVVQRLIERYKIPVSNQTVEEVLKSHPDYPSLKSICDGLNEWKVDNYPMRLDREELKDTGSPFIAHLNDKGEKLAFVPELNGNSKVTYIDSFGKSKTTDKEAFFKMYSGVSLLIDPDEKAGEEEYSEKIQVDFLHRSLPYLAGIALILFTAYSVLSSKAQLNITFTNAALLLTKLMGLGFSILLVLKDLNINSSFADRLCGFTKKTNCNSLLNTDAVKVFGWLHWSDIGMIYFLSGVLLMISIPEISDYKLMSIISFGALGYVVYSIYYQAVIAKTWCPLCLGVQAVFIADAALYFPYLLPVELSWISIMNYGNILLTIAFGVILYKGYFKNKQTSQYERLAYLKFKKNPTMFTNLLYQGKQKSFNITKEIFIVGQPGAPVEITAFLSLNCNPCQRAFNQLKTLFENKHIFTRLIFLQHDKDKAFVNQVAQLFVEKRQKEASKLLYTWYNAQGNERASLIKQAKAGTTDDSFELTKKAHRTLFTAAKVTGTPTVFVNGYKLPGEYKIADIPFFVDELAKR